MNDAIEKRIAIIMKEKISLTLDEFSYIVGANKDVIIKELSNNDDLHIQNDRVRLSSNFNKEEISDIYWGVGCNSCGYVNNPRDVFCEYCGNKSKINK
jgi:rRNA maturation endonuclease Nob1